MSEKRKITITDVADSLGVSKTTVSRAISGKGRIGKDTKDRVLRFISENDYVPNAMARGLAEQKTYNLGLCIPTDSAMFELPFFNDCMRGICEAAGESDYDVVVTMVSPRDTGALERLLSNRKVDGVILSRTYVSDPNVSLLKQNGIPFVTVGSFSTDDVVQIDSNHRTACEMLTSILISQGIEKIALLCGNPSHVVTNSRMNGFIDAYVKAGIKNSDKMVFRDNEGSLLERNLDAILDEDYDGIICMDDSICMRVIDKLKTEGVTVPKDIKLASFYYSKSLDRVTPQVTSLKFNAKELGRKAAKVLIDILSGREYEMKTLLGYEISLKDSTKMSSGDDV